MNRKENLESLLNYILLPKLKTIEYNIQVSHLWKQKMRTEREIERIKKMIYELDKKGGA